jgi:hypothetical protein
MEVAEILGLIKSKSEAGAASSAEFKTVMNLLNSAGCLSPSYECATELLEVNLTRLEYLPADGKSDLTLKP